MRILFLSRWYPFPPDNGSKIRVYNLLRGLCESHSVTLLSFIDPGCSIPGKSTLNPAPDEIKVCEYREFRSNSRKALLGYFSKVPRYIVDTYQPEMAGLIRHACQNARYDLVIASQTSMAAYHRCFAGIPAIFDEVELGLFRPNGGGERNGRGALRQRFTWEKHRRYVAHVLEQFHACTVVSERERSFLKEVAPNYHPVHVIPNCIDTLAGNRNSNGRLPNTLLFAGSMSYWPNYDAMSWFLTDVYPAVRTKVPGATLTITGDPGSRSMPAAPGVVHAGIVPDIHPVIASSSVSVVPMRSGGGTRLKILESLAFRTPVVTTSKGAEGLDVRTGEHLLIADTPGEFADAVVRLLHDPQYACSLAENGLRLVRERYDSSVVVPRFLRLAGEAARLS